MKKKPKIPGLTVDQQSVINTTANGFMQVWFASGWKLRPMVPDYHVDCLLERTEGGELTGKMVYFQQKAHVGVKFKDGLAREGMELKHLRYYAEKVEFPVFLVLVDTEKTKAWYPPRPSTCWLSHEPEGTDKAICSCVRCPASQPAHGHSHFRGSPL